MNKNVNSRKNAARTEKLQQKLDAGVVSTHFPQVTGIVINMTYDQRGIKQPLQRTVNFFPGSCALFKVECLNKDCTEGGFDLTHVITSMIGHRRETSKGKLSCEGNGAPADHSAIIFEVSIQYT